MKTATFIEDLNFGYTNFDWIGSALFSVFQAVTLEGWSFIMYQVCLVNACLVVLWPRALCPVCLLVGRYRASVCPGLALSVTRCYAAPRPPSPRAPLRWDVRFKTCTPSGSFPRWCSWSWWCLGHSSCSSCCWPSFGTSLRPFRPK